MAGIDGVRGPSMTGPLTRATRRASGSGFTAPSGGASAAAGPMAPSSVAALDGMLALQEADPGAVGDREARRHGQEMLNELTDLQRAVLSGEVDPQALQRLAGLAGAVPRAGDPQLRAVVEAVALRARIELARHGRAGP